MNRLMLVVVSVCCFALATACVCKQVEAATPFYDGFDDGDHTDGNPVLWSPGGAPDGERTVVEGRLVHTPDVSRNMSTYAKECLGDVDCHFDDVSLRSSFQVGGSRTLPTFVTLFARSLVEGTLYGGIDSSVRAVLAMSMDGKVTFLSRQATTDIDPLTEEVSLQFDVQGDAMSLWVWPADSTRPELPTTTATIPGSYPLASGTVGFFYNPGASTNVSFDFFQATPIPEPTSLGLAVLAAVAVATRRFHRK